MSWSNISSAGSIYGSGDLEIPKYMFDRIYEYLGSGFKKKNEGAHGSGRGTGFAISLSGKYSLSSYCPFGRQCVDQSLQIKQGCERRAKKITNQKEKCKLMFKNNKLKWNGLKIRLSQKDDIEASLARAGITVKGSSISSSSSNTSSNNNKTTRGKVTSIDTTSDEDIVSKIKKLNELYKSNVITKEEFKKAKSKLLN